MLVNGLEVGIMREGSVRQRETHGIGDALLGWRALQNFSGKEKVFLLLFGEGWFARGAEDLCGAQGENSKTQSAWREAKATHGNGLLARLINLRPARPQRNKQIRHSLGQGGTTSKSAC